MKTKTFTLETNRQGYYDITHTVHRVVAEKYLLLINIII